MENKIEIFLGVYFSTLFLVSVTIIIVDRIKEKRMKTKEKNKPETIYDEEHSFNMVMNKMPDDFTGEEIQDLINDNKENKDGV